MFVSAIAGVADVVLKLLLYYVYERAWNTITWGRSK